MSSRSLNKVMLIGNLTRDPDFHPPASDGGTPFCTFAVATNRTWKTSDGSVKESTDFHNLVAWGKLAEICNQLLRKGMKIYVEGSLTTRSWDDDSGVKRYKTEIRIDEMILLDSKGKLNDSDSVATDDGVSDEDAPEMEKESNSAENMVNSDTADEDDPLSDEL